MKDAILNTISENTSHRQEDVGKAIVIRYKVLEDGDDVVVTPRASKIVITRRAMDVCIITGYDGQHAI